MVQVHSHVGASEKGVGPPRTCQQGHTKVCAETLTKQSLPYKSGKRREQGCSGSRYICRTCSFWGRSAGCRRWWGETIACGRSTTCSRVREGRTHLAQTLKLYLKKHKQVEVSSARFAFTANMSFGPREILVDAEGICRADPGGSCLCHMDLFHVTILPPITWEDTAAQSPPTRGISALKFTSSLPQ